MLWGKSKEWDQIMPELEVLKIQQIFKEYMSEIFDEEIERNLN